MKENHNEPDKKILEKFRDVFAPMNIGEYEVVRAMYSLSLEAISFDEERKLDGDGIYANSKDIEKLLSVSEPEGYLTYKGRPIVVYLRDQFLKPQNYKAGRYNPYHICMCDALRRAMAGNRYEARYVMTYNKSANFMVNLFVRNHEYGKKTEKKEQGVYRMLRVCQDCLRELNYKNFRRYCGHGIEWFKGGNPRKRAEIVDSFRIDEFLMTPMSVGKSRLELGEHRPLGGPKKEYQLTPEVKEELKKLAGYCCEICENQFPSDKLQIHHRNHQEGINTRGNLVVMCEKCHDELHKREDLMVNPNQDNDITDKQYGEAASKLAYIYAHGKGVIRDSKKAEEYAEKARQAGYSYTEENMPGNGFEENAAKFMADRGDAYASFIVAKCYETSDEEIIADKAVDYYRKAARIYPEIIQKYEDNQSIDKLKSNAGSGSKAAAERLKKLADRGDVEAMMAYADILFGGE